jgi:hypothetical protein
MKATLLVHSKTDDATGAVTEIRIWQVPATEHTPFGLKYSLAYIEHGIRIVGYDNERGKGDHRHYDGEETPYRFVEVDSLIADFRRDVAAWRGEI